MGFRKDINGLRAIAVIAVVFYHFDFKWLSGGFAGVDVFFVISGFLMTSIIFRGLKSESFNLFSFYRARIKRIVPALAVLCFSILILGWFYISPIGYAELGNHVMSSLLFFSNVTYWLESGYFDAASNEKWLLHTWSLSVEWQFYLVYPLVLLFLKKFMRIESIRYFVLAATVLGFVFCIVSSYRWPTAAFYLLPTRTWEMMLGGVAFLYPMHLGAKGKQYMEMLGISFIMFSYLFLNTDDIWPGYLAAFPVLGTFLVIQADRNKSLITGSFLFQRIGLYSYSIYLWHWPVVVALNYMGKSGDFNLSLFGVALSFFMGFVSYSLIENKVGRLKTTRVVTSVFVSVPLLCFCGLIIYLIEGVKFRAEENTVMPTERLVMPSRSNGYCFYDFNSEAELKLGAEAEAEGWKCSLGTQNSEPKTLLFGDSYAAQYEPFWDAVAKHEGFTIKSVTTNWCYPSIGDNFTWSKTHSAYKQCIVNRKRLVSTISDYKNIIVSGAWSGVYSKGYIEDVKELIDYSLANGLKVFIMPSPTIYDTNVLKRFIDAHSFGQSFQINSMPKSKDEIAIEANVFLANYAAKKQGVFFLKKSSLFDVSDMFVRESGIKVPYSLDGGHISLEGSIEASKVFIKSEEYQSLIKQMTIN
jgi:peptidoglycan/LPS O-acetylase OafA/YrhL